jgi:hypothetical protein
MEFCIGEPFIIEFDIVNQHEFSNRISCWYRISLMKDVRLGTSQGLDDQVGMLVLRSQWRVLP